jgi:hypothetical protein
MNIYTGERTEGQRRIHNMNMGFSLPLSRYEGLSTTDGETKFVLRAAAGTIAFDGHFSDGKGAGHFAFTPSDAFVREMSSMGYSDLTTEKLLLLATTDVQPSIIRELRSMGYDVRDRDLDEVAVFHITPDVVREYARAGYPNLTMRELVNFRVGRVDAAYIDALRQLGYSNIPARTLADMAILGVTPDYIRSLRSAGVEGVPPKQLVDMRVFKIDGDYIREMNALGITDIKKMIDLRVTGASDILLKKKSR